MCYNEQNAALTFYVNLQIYGLNITRTPNKLGKDTYHGVSDNYYA
jgi:hypothetical protein